MRYIKEKIQPNISYKIAVIILLLSSLQVITSYLIPNSQAQADTCFMADDVGTSYIVNVPATAQSSDDIIKTYNEGNIIVNKWIDTGLMAFGGVPIVAKIKKIPSYQQEWYPWGKVPGINKICPNSNKNNSGSPQYVIDTDYKNYGCKLNKGIGMYGLISFSGENPNTQGWAQYPPHEKFQNFHMGEYAEDKPDAVVINVDKAPYINNRVIMPGEFEPLKQGTLYLKILDEHYKDNYGGYTVMLDHGVYKLGFITKFFNYYKNSLDKTSKLISAKVRAFISKYVRPLLYLAIIVQFMSYLIGISEMNNKDLFVRIFKIAIVMSLLSDTGYKNTIEKYLVTFINGEEKISSSGITYYTGGFGENIASKITTYYLSRSDNFIDSDNNSMLKTSVASTDINSELPTMVKQTIVFDKMMYRIISKQVHLKIWVLLFTHKFYFIFLLYLYLYLFIVMILKLLLMIVTAYMRINLAIMVLPIFLLTILFKITQDLFQNWLKNVTASSMALIVISLYTFFMFTMMGDDFFSLLYYKICKKGWWIFKIYVVDDYSVLNSVLSMEKYLIALIMMLIFTEIQGQLLSISDNFTGVYQESGVGSTFNSALNRAESVIDGTKNIVQKNQIYKNMSKKFDINRARNRALGEMAAKHTGFDKLISGMKFMNTIAKLGSTEGPIAGIFQYLNSGGQNDNLGISEWNSDVDRRRQEAIEKISKLQKKLDE